LVTVNVTHWEGQVLFYTPTLTIANVVLSLLMAGLVANLGVLISMRAATVQGAQQNLMAATLFPLVFLQMVPIFLLNVVPDGRTILKELVAAANPEQILLIIISVLAVLDLCFLTAAMARFRRSKLILS
jgi:ABC-2 type transport system permease protein